jgi:uncharacterized protein (DUF302 family)
MGVAVEPDVSASLRSELSEKPPLARIAERPHLMTGKTQTDDATITTCFLNVYLKNSEEISNMASTTDKGIINKLSNHSVEQTVERLKNILQSKGVTLFALVDHSGEAEKVGMSMLPTKLLIFGSPKAGTSLMLAVPSIAIDLPLKILIWEDSKGKVWVSYNSLDYIKERHGLPQELLQNIAIIETLASKAGE